MPRTRSVGTTDATAVTRQASARRGSRCSVWTGIGVLYGAEPSLQQLVISGDRRQNDATIRLSSTVARREQGNIRLYAVYFAPVKHYAAQSRRILVMRRLKLLELKTENEVMQYVDGFVLPVRKERMADYKAIVEAAAEIWKEHGALEYWECIGDDLGTEKGTGSFADMTNATEDENVIFGWVVFESREARDAANEKVAADPRMGELMDPENPIFDFQRMAYAGFKTMVHID